MYKLVVAAILFLSFINIPKAYADYFVYDVICEPTQYEDIARVMTGRIYLALQADETVQDASIYVSVQKDEPTVRQLKEKRLLRGTGFSFNSEDLSVSVGGKARGHACYREATLTVRLTVDRTDGTIDSNEFTVPILVPGAYATKSKVRVRRDEERARKRRERRIRNRD